MLSTRDTKKMNIPQLISEFQEVMNGCLNTRPPHKDNAYLLLPYLKRMKELRIGMRYRLHHSKMAPDSKRIGRLKSSYINAVEVSRQQWARYQQLPTFAEWVEANSRTVEPPSAAPARAPIFANVGCNVIRGDENIAVARSNSMAKRIAAALNWYVPRSNGA